MTDYLQKAREMLLFHRTAIFNPLTIAVLANTLEAQDKAQAKLDALREAVSGEIKAIEEGCSDDVYVVAQELRKHLNRTLIQPEPDPFAVAIAEANESYLAGTGDLADHIREALARHGLAVKEVARHD